MSHERAPILIMTATIAPPIDAHKLVHTDPVRRLEDYASALQFYLKALEASTVSGIVFVENSGADMSALTDLVADWSDGDRVEFLQFDGLDYPGSYGRAYGEFKLLDYAMEHAKTIQSASGTQRVWKVTGRYRVLNLRAVLLGADARSNMWAHCRNHPMRWADMYLFGWRKDFYRRSLAGLYTELNESSLSTSAEVAFRDWLDGQPASARIGRRMRPAPELEGIRGFDGASYGDRRIRSLVRKIASAVVPWIWV